MPAQASLRSSAAGRGNDLESASLHDHEWSRLPRAAELTEVDVLLAQAFRKLSPPAELPPALALLLRVLLAQELDHLGRAAAEGAGVELDVAGRGVVVVVRVRLGRRSVGRGGGRREREGGGGGVVEVGCGGG